MRPRINRRRFSRRRFLAGSLLTGPLFTASLASGSLRSRITGRRPDSLAGASNKRSAPRNRRGRRKEADYGIVVLGATPAGLCAGIAAARLGSRVLLLERTGHLGGLPANGLGATDIATRGATGGLFRDFVRRVHHHYIETYGADSMQARDCSDGHHFEPHVAEAVFEAMVKEEAGLTVRRNRQFDAHPGNVYLEGRNIKAISVWNRKTGRRETVRGSIFIDAIYEGDLAAAAGAPYRTRREGKEETGEPFAGRVYRPWGYGRLGEGSTEIGDDTIQAYNYRLCLTDRDDLRVSIRKPRGYRRSDYASLADDVRAGKPAHFMPRPESDTGVVNPVWLPNGKTDSNNHHRAFLSTDLPEENWAYPNAGWKWRDRFAVRLRNYTLGLLWFCQNDAALPESFRAEARRWGLARDEYANHRHFPRQIYVREARRIEGERLFSALDAMDPTDVERAYAVMEGTESPKPNGRAPVQIDSITASHYPIDSHAVRKREPGRIHLDGFLSLGPLTRTYQVPYGVIVPRKVDGLLVPVACSATHLGFGTLRMEPCWMALGQAAGVAAHLSIEMATTPRALPIDRLQKTLLDQNAVLIHLPDVSPNHPHFAALQYYGCRGFFAGPAADPDAFVDEATLRQWATRARVENAPSLRDRMTRAEALSQLFRSPRRVMNPTITIPWIDLARERHRQTIVDREPGQYLGHPTTTMRADGVVLCVYPKGHGRGAIVMKRSHDFGRTWSERLPVPENWSTSQETPTIHTVFDRSGRRRLILFSGLYPIRMAISEDDGDHWSPLEPIGDYGGIVAMASVEPIGKGRYLALFHDDGRYLRNSGSVDRFRVYQTISEDGGLTWGTPTVIAEHPEAHLCEPGAIRSPDGRTLAVLLRENSRRFNSFVIFTRDNGRTWSPPRELPGSLMGDRHVARYDKDGRLFVSFRDTNPESPTWGDWVGWVGSYDDIENGRQGQYRIRLMDNTKDADCAYPAIEWRDGEFLVTTYGHWTVGEPPYIVSVRFSLDELDSRL